MQHCKEVGEIDFTCVCTGKTQIVLMAHINGTRPWSANQIDSSENVMLTELKELSYFYQKKQFYHPLYAQVLLYAFLYINKTIFRCKLAIYYCQYISNTPEMDCFRKKTSIMIKDRTQIFY